MDEEPSPGATGQQDYTDYESRPKRRRSRLPAAILAGVGLVSLAVAGVWIQRKPIAQDYIQKELDRRGVQAQYDLTEMGFRTQRIENLAIGDPHRPDLTAEWAEIRTKLGFGGFEITEIRAHGVRLSGRLIDGSFRFGAIDKLLPPPSGKPFALPDLNVALTDSAVRLDMPNGVVGVALAGRGNLANGFHAKLATHAPALAFESCSVTGASGIFDLSIAHRRPNLTGPLRAQGFACPDGAFSLTNPKMIVEARFNEALDQWQGSAGIDIAEGRFADNRLSRIIGTIGFEGDAAATRGDVKMTAGRLAAASATAEALSVRGDYRVSTDRKGISFVLDGHAQTKKAALSAEARSGIRAMRHGAAGTPVAPLVTALAEAADRAAGAASLSGEFRLAHSGSAGALHIGSLAALSESGARASLGEGKGVRVAWPGAGNVQIDGKMTLGGGGFPATIMSLRQPRAGGPIDGVARIAPLEVEGARMALTPVSFRADPRGGNRFDTQVTLDGPIGDGRVQGVTLPLNGRFDMQGNFLLNQTCVPIGFSAVKASGLVLGPHKFRLCPAHGPALFARRANGAVSGGARLEDLKLVGRMGDEPISIMARSLAFGMARSEIDADAIQLRLGSGSDATRLDIAGISSGGSGRDGLGGEFSGLSGKLARVPLDITESSGKWRWHAGALGLQGQLRVADAQTNEPRFNPLVSRDFALQFRDGGITASGTLLEPKSGRRVTAVSIAHALSTGAGRAVLTVDDLRFGENLQPDTLTPKALGVVANVQGAVDGRGEIRWDRKSITSDGVFRTDNMNLAAAFGPVTALTGEIHFSDLLGMSTPPGQKLALGEVNPGISVLNGVVGYQLLPDFKVRIEGGRWPFAGGELILEPTVLDMAEAKERRLTFKVIGLDAAQFINQFQMKDISATGTFDGVLPMIFDAQGGRIEGGRLVVRRGGGELAYVGQVSNEQLGTFGTMAFDALKSMKYDTLVIELNGAIDGEMVTEVRFSGVNEGTVEVAEQSLVKEFVGLPFIFNIKVKAPFRGLLSTARSFTDPGLLIRQNLPGFEPAETPMKPVQPKESETMQ